MDDLISRQAAIDAVVGCTNCGTEDVLRAYVTKHSLENGWTGGIVDALGAIEQLPSAQPERKKGKWVFNNGLKQFFCDQCGEPSLTYDDIYIYSMDFPHFCPDCGADMRGGVNGQK